MTELERICLKQNATELRRVAKIMSALQNADRNEVGFLTRQISINEEIDDLKADIKKLESKLSNYEGI